MWRRDDAIRTPRCHQRPTDLGRLLAHAKPLSDVQPERHHA